MRLAVLALVVLSVLSGCLDGRPSRCASGLVCPDTHVCNDELDRCVLTSCGDGFVDVGEECDGADLAGNSCAETRRDVDGDGLEEAFHSGQLSCAADCSLDVSDCHYCGDKVLDVPFELCDGNDDLTVRSCLAYGYDRGELSCSADCRRLVDDCSGIGWIPVLTSHDGLLGIATSSSPREVLIRTAFSVRTFDGQEEVQERLLPPGAGAFDSSKGGWAMVLVLLGDGMHQLEVRSPDAVWTTTALPEIDENESVAVTQIVDDGSGGYRAYCVSSDEEDPQGQRILIFDGTEWTTIDAPGPTTWSSIWVRGAGDFYVAGPAAAGGGEPTTIQHYDGSTWSVVFSDESGEPIHDLQGLSTELYVATASGLNRLVSTTLEVVLAIVQPIMWIDSVDHRMVGSGTDEDGRIVVSVDGRDESTGNVPGLVQIIGTGPWSAYARNDDTLFRFDGSSWDLYASGQYKVRDVWSADHDTALAVGDSGRTLLFDADGWTDLCTLPCESDGAHNYLAVDANSTTDAVAFARYLDADADDTRSTLYRWNGDNWTPEHSELASIFDVAIADDRGLAVGLDGYTARFDGTSWSSEILPTRWRLNTVEAVSATEFLAVGRGATSAVLLRFDGDSWQELLTVDGEEGAAVWSDGNEIHFMTNSAGHHFDGAAWRRHDFAATTSIQFVAGSDRADIFAFGSVPYGGRVLKHWDGDRWLDVRPHPQLGFDSLSVQKGRIFFGGPKAYGALRRFTPWDGCRAVETECSDGVDDDCDGAVDGSDSDC